MSDYDIIAAHIVETLPDSLSQRVKVLESLSNILPNRAKSRETVRTMLTHLRLHSISQRELPFTINEAEKK